MVRFEFLCVHSGCFVENGLQRHKAGEALGGLPGLETKQNKMPTETGISDREPFLV